MKIGKVSETVLKRSVLQQLNQKQSNQDDIGKSAGIGKDCALFTCEDRRQMAFSIQPFCMDFSDRVTHAIVSALNNVAAGGTDPIGVLLSILLPPDSEEKDLKRMISLAGEVCAEYKVKIYGGHTEITDGVTRPIITAVGVGAVKKEEGSGPKGAAGSFDRKKEEHSSPKVTGSFDEKKVRAGQDILVSKWIGLEGTALLAHKYEKELLGRYPANLVEEAKTYARYLSIIPEAVAARPYACAMHDVRGGGIFGALWELAERTGVGLKVDLKKIPVKQETIEVCEFVDCNPYELLSGGMLLIIADQGEKLADNLKKSGIHARVIGKTTDNNDKVVINEEEIRYLTPFKEDAICAFNARKAFL